MAGRSIINTEENINKEEQVKQTTKENEQVVIEEKKDEKKVLTRLDENMLVNVVSRVKGGLIYVSPRTRIPYRFDDYGYENVMELSELRSMLSSQRKFFERGWIEVLDYDVVAYLKLERFEKKAIDQDDVDYILNTGTPEEIKNILSNANTNTRRIIFGFARERYVNGELNNVHTIRAIEEILNQKIDPNS